LTYQSHLILQKVVRGIVPVRVECAPAFDYARAKHTTEIVPDDSYPGGGQTKVFFKSGQLNIDLRYVSESTMECVDDPLVDLKLLDLSQKGHLGPAAYCDLELVEGQVVTFILRTPPEVEMQPRFTPTVERANKLGVDLDSMPIVCV
jgi:hypothetical protein